MSDFWSRAPTPEEIERLQPWIVVHDFAGVCTAISDGSETSSDFFAFRHDLFKEILSTLSAGSPSRSLVEIGCASGLLCVAAAESGWQAVGYDPRPLHIEQARFIAGLIDQAYTAPRFEVGDHTVLDGTSRYDVVACYQVLQLLPDPYETLCRLCECAGTALVLEAAVYLPRNPPPILTGGPNWVFNALSMVTNHGAGAHNKKGVTEFGVLLSYPALIYLLKQAGFDRVARVTVPESWRRSRSRGIKKFFTGEYQLLIALKANARVGDVPAEWTWMTGPPDVLNYGYEMGDSLARNRRAIDSFWVSLGRRLAARLLGH